MVLEKTVRKLMLLAGISLLGGCMQSKLAYDKEMPQARELAVMLDREFEADGAIRVTEEDADFLIGYLKLKEDLNDYKPVNFWEQRSRMQNMPRLPSYRYNQQIRQYHTQRR